MSKITVQEHRDTEKRREHGGGDRKRVKKKRFVHQRLLLDIRYTVFGMLTGC